MFLEECPEAIGMTPIQSVFVFQWDGNLTGVQLIAESHIIVHTYTTKRWQIYIDIFTCKTFDKGRAVELAKQCLGLVAPNVVEIPHRGLEFI